MRDLRDLHGNVAWRARTTRGFAGGGLADPAPWYRGPPDDLTFPRPGEPGAPLHYAGGVIVPAVDRGGATAYEWDRTYILGRPIVQWDNPTGRAVTLEAGGELALTWREDAAAPVEVVVAVLRADGTEDRLLAETAAPPADGSRTRRFDLSALPPFAVGPDDQLVIAHRLTESGHRRQTRLEDRVTLRLVR